MNANENQPAAPSSSKSPALRLNPEPGEHSPREGPMPLSHNSFAGEFAAEVNALRSALHTAAIDAGHNGEYCEYDFLDEVPRTSLTVELVNALHRHGYEITKR